MATSTAYISSEALSKWFKPENYKDLGTATLAEWVHIIEDRVRLQTLLETGQVELFKTLFPGIQRVPTNPLGFTQKSTRRPHPTDTASMQSLTCRQISALAEIATQRGASAQDLFDGSVPADRSDGLAGFAHPRVNLRATDAQLKADFAKWLKAWRGQSGTVTKRKYQSAVKAWKKNELVPYFDLCMFAAADGKKIAPKTFQGLLKLDDTYMECLKTLKASAKAVFNDATAQALRLAAAA